MHNYTHTQIFTHIQKQTNKQTHTYIHNTYIHTYIHTYSAYIHTYINILTLCRLKRCEAGISRRVWPQINSEGSIQTTQLQVPRIRTGKKEAGKKVRCGGLGYRSYTQIHTYIYHSYIHTCICTYIHTYNLKLSNLHSYIHTYILPSLRLKAMEVQTKATSSRAGILDGAG